jgi:opacity protein-like surface antigen
VGGFLGYNKPMFKLGDRFKSDANKFGFNISYVPSAKATIEVEYHRAKFDHGALETQTFFWGPTKQNYVSPNANYTMKFNSLLMNGLIFLRKNRSMAAHSFSPYIAVGAGFYDYNALSTNVLYPSQTEAEALRAGGGKDAQGRQIPAVVMSPAQDTQTALSATLGFGLESFVSSSMALDIRARYNFVIGELRPFEDWKLQKVFPLQLIDVSAGLKFYFWQ